MNFIKKIILLFLINLAMINILQGQDWANLDKYKDSNLEIINMDDPQRVVFMGNSITEGWSNYNKDFFIENPFNTSKTDSTDRIFPTPLPACQN